MARNMYQDAIDVQDASNPNGVVNSLQEAMQQIREEPGYREVGTRYVTEHPVFVLFADKLASMAGMHGTYSGTEKYSQAYRACEEKAKNATQQEAASSS